MILFIVIDYLLDNAMITPRIAAATATNARQIQIGENTQIHDQVATTPQPPNLRVTKIRVKIVAQGHPALFFMLFC